MDHHCQDMYSDMNEAIPPALPQTSSEIDYLDPTQVNFKFLESLSHELPKLNELMDFVCAERDASLPPETCSQPLTTHSSSNFIQHNQHPSVFSPRHQGEENIFQPQNTMPDFNQRISQGSFKQPRKRGPKAPTMSAKFWKPYENLIRRLYVTEAKSVAEVREIMFKDHGIDATERQYYNQFERMNIQRNVKRGEREAVAKHIKYRQSIGKSSHVRIRGHKKKTEDLIYGARRTLAGPPSPIPSYIKITTDTESGSDISSIISGRSAVVNRIASASGEDNAILKNLFKYAQHPKSTLDSQEARAVFNDLRRILSKEFFTRNKATLLNWNPMVKNPVRQVKNSLAVTQALFVLDESNEIHTLLSRNGLNKLSKLDNCHATWKTPYGTVQASFWTSKNDSNLDNQGSFTSSTDKFVAARVAIIPNDISTGTPRVLFDFTPNANPFATMSYQAMIPNDSVVFRVAQYGKVEDLISLFESGFASLTDHDEQGRSLLSYAMTDSNVDVCKFLVDKNADVNGMEPNEFGAMTPLHAHQVGLDVDVPQIIRHKRARCWQIMMIAGADVSLNLYDGEGWSSVFGMAVSSSSFETFKDILDFGEPFISVNNRYPNGFRERSALQILARECGYRYGNIMDVVDKAILILNRGANIFCRNDIGDTVLHSLLKSERLQDHARGRKEYRWSGPLRKEIVSKSPKNLLMLFITAGADVYAVNNMGLTPSHIAFEYGRQDEWIECLEKCGFEYQEVLGCCVHNPTRFHQRSKLSFEDYCVELPRLRHPSYYEENDYSYEGEDSSEEDDSDDNEEDCDEDYSEDGSEAESSTNYTDNMGFQEVFGGRTWVQYGIDADLDHESGNHVEEIGDMGQNQRLDVDEWVGNSNHGGDINFEDWIDNGMDFMQDCIDFSMCSDT